MKNNKPATFCVIKVILAAFIIGNVIYSSIMIILRQTDYIKEVLLKTGISAAIAIIMLLTISAIEMLNQRKWKRKIGEIFLGSEDFRLLKCSGGYYQLPIAVVLIDMMIAVMFFREYGTDISALSALIADKRMVSPFLTLIFFHIVTLFTVLYYCGYKVCYTEYQIYTVHFMRKVTFSYDEIKKITFLNKNPHKSVIIIQTEYEKLKLCSDVLSDGWEEFKSCIFDVAEQRNIPTEYASPEKQHR